MMTYTSCTYYGAEDLQLMFDLLVAARPVDRITVYPSLVDLHEVLAMSKVQANTRLWFDTDDQLIAFAFVDHYRNLWFEYDPQVVHPHIETEIVVWGVSCVRRCPRTENRPLTLRATCHSDDIQRLSLFDRHGFEKQDRYVLRMARSLSDSIPAPCLPEGFHIRNVTGEGEAEALVLLHRAAFGTENMTVEERLAMMRVPGYDAALDLLVVAPDGQLAAYCMCSVCEEENARTGRSESYADPIATHRDYQRRGLARALLLTGLHKLKARGIDVVSLGTGSDNVAMQQLAQSVGFCVHSKKLWYSKSVKVDEK